MKSITDLPFVDCGVPRALLTAIIETKKSSIKALSLRALATVCVTGDAVKQFEEVSIKKFHEKSIQICKNIFFIILKKFSCFYLKKYNFLK